MWLQKDKKSVFYVDSGEENIHLNNAVKVQVN